MIKYVLYFLFFWNSNGQCFIFFLIAKLIIDITNNFWFLPQDQPSDYGIPMIVKYSLQKNLSVTEELLSEMVRILVILKQIKSLYSFHYIKKDNVWNWWTYDNLFTCFTESCDWFLSWWTRLDKVSTVLAAHAYLPRQIKGKNRMHVLIKGHGHDFV